MLINRDNVCLVIFNMQLELIPLLRNSYHLAHDCTWLADLFQTHELPIVFTEHKKLGQLLPAMTKIAPQATVLEKHHFSLHQEPHIVAYLLALNKKQLVFAGAESHVCLLHSAVALRSLGYEVYFVEDAMSARSDADNEAAKTRLLQQGFQLITKEMLFFELIEQSESPNYLDLSLKFLDGRYIKSNGM